MPLYEYKCGCGKQFERFLPIARYDEPQICDCGQAATKKLAAPAVRGDYAGYSCPVSGKWIEGRRAHEENLARTNCRVLEPGEVEASKRRREAEDAKLEEAVGETAARIVAEMPREKQEKLATEMAHFDVSIARS